MASADIVLNHIFLSKWISVFSLNAFFLCSSLVHNLLRYNYGFERKLFNYPGQQSFHLNRMKSLKLISIRYTEEVINIQSIHSKSKLNVLSKWTCLSQNLFFGSFLDPGILTTTSDSYLLQPNLLDSPVGPWHGILTN